jgi:exo beta-1,2-glucooligosaccharide sophorohydrolase (non-reducing end)
MPEHYYHRLIFDNSLTAGSYQPSRGAAIAPSELELVAGRLPVAEDYFFSPPNCLRLSWRSRPGGDWQAELWVEHWRGRELAMVGDTLTLWWLSPAPVAADDLPMLQLALEGNRHTRPLRLGPLVGDLPAGAWRQLQIPLSAFGTSTGELDYSRLRGLIFSQGIDDAAAHTLYVDEVKLRERAPALAVAGGDVSLSARGYERHVDLRWRPLDDPAVDHYRILAAAGDGPLEPVGTQNPHFNRYSHYVGSAFGRHRYRVEAVDHDGVASPVSTEVGATTAPMSDDELLDMVQEACLRLYWEAAHPDAGMALECVPGNEHLVALGASGFGVLAILAGAERGFIEREDAAGRLLQILEFLGRADRFHGVWPTSWTAGAAGRSRSSGATTTAAIWSKRRLWRRVCWRHGSTLTATARSSTESGKKSRRSGRASSGTGTAGRPTGRCSTGTGRPNMAGT